MTSGLEATTPPNPPLQMPGRFPEGRCGTDEFCRLAGLAKTTFFVRYRQDPHYIELWDIRVDSLGRLNFSVSAARRFGQQRAGGRVHGNAGRFPSRPCPYCTKPIHPRVLVCKHCGRWLPRAESTE
jgi:hypothetical protein